MHRAIKYTLFILISAVSIMPWHVSQFQGFKNIPFFQYFGTHYPFSPNFAVFDTLFNVCAYIDCWKKKQPFYLFSCTSIISTFKYKCSPPPPVYYWHHFLNMNELIIGLCVCDSAGHSDLRQTYQIYFWCVCLSSDLRVDNCMLLAHRP